MENSNTTDVLEREVNRLENEWKRMRTVLIERHGKNLVLRRIADQVLARALEERKCSLVHKN